MPLPVIQEYAGKNDLNMTTLALNLSKYINGVAKKHGEVSKQMFPGYDIESITNGIHSAFWTSSPLRVLYDQYIPGWTADPFSLRYALGIPDNQLLHNYPNPFAGSTTIHYYVPEPSHVVVKITGIDGIPVAVLVNESKGPGWYEVAWNGTESVNGFYICTFSSGHHHSVIKIIQIK